MTSLREEAADFLDYLEDWAAQRPLLSLAEIVAEAGGAANVGIFCVDVINGFCHEGPLSSSRVAKIIPPMVALFRSADAAGVTHFVLTHDAHAPDAAEFQDFPPHCVRETRESDIAPELMALPFAAQYEIIPKNSISSDAGTTLNGWLDAHPQITHFLVVGDCTDLCIYQMAMRLKVRANAANLHHSVILPVDCVNTFDIPVGAARAANILPHPADFFHATFLYSMAQNGIRIAQSVI